MRSLVTACVAALCIAPVAGCGLGEDRAEHHLRRAAELLAADRGPEATLELRAAAQLRPDDRALSIRVAELAAAHGRPDLAVEYYEDAHSLDPSDEETTLALARLLIHQDPDRAIALTKDVLSRSPRSAPAHLVAAEAMLAANNVPEARRLAELAGVFAPDDPDVEWVKARVYEARARIVRATTGAGVSNADFLQLILDAYDAYEEKGGEMRIGAALGRARTLGSWVGRREQAREAYEEALDLAEREGAPREQIEVYSAVGAFGRNTGDTALERRALEPWVALAPNAFPAWERLAELPGPDGEDVGDRVYARMLEANPESASAHVVYARRLARTSGYGSAIAHLESQLGAGMDDAVLLTGIVNLHYTHHRPRDAERVLERLQREYGDRPATALLVARQQISGARYDDAVATLRTAIAQHESVEAQTMLARAELGRGRYDDALAAVDRALELSSVPAPESLRLKARIEMARGDGAQAARTLLRLQTIDALDDADRLMMARAWYDAGIVFQGRRILEAMVSREDPNPDAAVELALREAGDERRAPLLRRYLEAAHARYPGHVGVLDALVRQDLERGEPETALARTAETIARRPRDGRLHLARARLLIRVGRYGEAGASAARAAELSPEVADDAYDVLTLVATQSPGATAYAVGLLETSLAEGTASADQIALLARLVLHAGDRARAVTLYEQALADGSRLAMPRNDLAFLLAESGEDLDRALDLAREAMSLRGEHPAVADTLGYVYLKSGNYEAAFWQFRQVTREADPPVAEYYYHLGLALMKLERLADARDALAEALRIDPDFPAAADAMRELDGGDVVGANGTRAS